jgi:hypothetical protein
MHIILCISIFGSWMFKTLVFDSWLFMFISNNQLSQILNFNCLMETKLKDWTNERNEIFKFKFN